MLGREKLGQNSHGCGNSGADLREERCLDLAVQGQTRTLSFPLFWLAVRGLLKWYPHWQEGWWTKHHCSRLHIRPAVPEQAGCAWEHPGVGRGIRQSAVHTQRECEGVGPLPPPPAFLASLPRPWVRRSAGLSSGHSLCGKETWHQQREGTSCRILLLFLPVGKRCRCHCTSSLFEETSSRLNIISLPKNLPKEGTPIVIHPSTHPPAHPPIRAVHVFILLSPINIS